MPLRALALFTLLALLPSSAAFMLPPPSLAVPATRSAALGRGAPLPLRAARLYPARRSAASGATTWRSLQVQEEDVVLQTATGPMPTRVIRPVAGGRYPAIVFYSEIFQRTAPIIRAASYLAGHGFVVAVPEIYHDTDGAAGWVGEYDDAGADRGNELKKAKEVGSYDSDAAAVVAFLSSHSSSTGKVGSAGFCIGGHLAMRAALQPGVSAAACWYPTDVHSGDGVCFGAAPEEDTLARVPELADRQVELLMIYGRQDPHVDYTGRFLTYSALHKAGCKFSWHEFNGAHAFMRDEGSKGRFDPELYAQTMAIAVDMFRRKLSEGDQAAVSEGAYDPLLSKC